MIRSGENSQAGASSGAESGEALAPGDAQINVPPSREGRLWKAISAALRCPACGSSRHKAETGKRRNHDGLFEQYRHCEACGIRFRAVFE